MFACKRLCYIYLLKLGSIIIILDSQVMVFFCLALYLSHPLRGGAQLIELNWHNFGHILPHIFIISRFHLSGLWESKPALHDIQLCLHTYMYVAVCLSECQGNLCNSSCLQYTTYICLPASCNGSPSHSMPESLHESWQTFWVNVAHMKRSELPFCYLT